MKIIKTFEPNGLCGSNFAYLFILILSSHWYAKRWRGFAEDYFGQSRSFSENAHNSKITVCDTVARLCYKNNLGKA